MAAARRPSARRMRCAYRTAAAHAIWWIGSTVMGQCWASNWASGRAPPRVLRVDRLWCGYGWGGEGQGERDLKLEVGVGEAVDGRVIFVESTWVWLESALLDEDELSTRSSRELDAPRMAPPPDSERNVPAPAPPPLAADAETRGTGAVPVSPSPRLARRLAALVPPACVVCEPTRGWALPPAERREPIAGTDEGRARPALGMRP